MRGQGRDRDPRDAGVYVEGERLRVRLRHPNDWRRLIQVGTFDTITEARRARDRALERLQQETPPDLSDHCHVRQHGPHWRACPLLPNGVRVYLSIHETYRAALVVALAYLVNLREQHSQSQEQT